MDDLISRQQAIDALAEDMPSAYTPDGSHPADEGIFMAQEIYADCIQTLKELPPAEPKIGKWIDDGDPLMLKCGNCGYGVMRYNATHFCPNCGQKKEVEHDG